MVEGIELGNSILKAGDVFNEGDWSSLEILWKFGRVATLLPGPTNWGLMGRPTFMAEQFGRNYPEEDDDYKFLLNSILRKGWGYK